MKKVSKVSKDIIVLVITVVICIAGWFISDIFIKDSNISDNVRNVAKTSSKRL